MKPSDENRLTALEAEMDAMKNRVTGMESRLKKTRKDIPDIKATGKKD